MKKQFTWALVLSLVLLFAGAGMVMAADTKEATEQVKTEEAAEITIQGTVTKTETGFTINEYAVLEMDLTDLVGKNVTAVGVPSEQEGKKMISIITIEEAK